MGDSGDRNIIMVIALGLLLYLFFIKGNIKIKNDWLNVKCSPIKLFLDSINSDPVESVGAFSECVNEFNKKLI